MGVSYIFLLGHTYAMQECFCNVLWVKITHAERAHIEHHVRGRTKNEHAFNIYVYWWELEVKFNSIQTNTTYNFVVVASNYSIPISVSIRRHRHSRTHDSRKTEYYTRCMFPFLMLILLPPPITLFFLFCSRWILNNLCTKYKVKYKSKSVLRTKYKSHTSTCISDAKKTCLYIYYKTKIDSIVVLQVNGFSSFAYKL